MRGHTKTRHVDADDAHAVDGLGQQLQQHGAGGGHAQVDDDHGVVLGRVALGVHRVADVLEQLARDQAFAVEGHVAHTAAGAVEVAGEGQAVDAAGAAAQDGAGAAHAQPYAQRTEGRAHALRLVVRACAFRQRVVLLQLLDDVALAGGFRRGQHGVAPGMAAQAILLRGSRVGERAFRQRHR
jgi:hypothetical protein